MIKIIETEYRHPVTGKKLEQNDVKGPMVNLLENILQNNFEDIYCEITATEDCLIITIPAIGFTNTRYPCYNNFQEAVNNICGDMIHSLAESTLNRELKEFAIG
jgi:hypothetical protein